MYQFKKSLLALSVAAAAGAATTASAQDGVTSSIAEMVTNGTAKIDVRYRFEYVDQDGIDEEAEANTIRSRLTFASAAYKGFSFLAEFDDVRHIGDDDFNDTNNGNTDYPVVADPDGTDVNQAWIKYTGDSASGNFGRQRILHGSQRFVGGVGWRQNEQTYDGFRAEWKGGPGLSADVSYVYNVNRIFGPDNGPVQPAELEGDNYFGRFGWQINDNHSVTAFAYLLDIDEEEDYPAGRSVGNSSDTYGAEYAGKFGPVSAKAGYATQSDAGDSELDYDASWYMAELGATFFGVKGIVGYEVLEGDNGVGFKTPYATLHKFQGWADKFLVTPGDGIEDAYVGLTGKLGPVKLGAFYHDFQANDSSTDFGTELDLVATWPVNKNLSLQLKYAAFDTDDEDRYTDTDKAWFTAQVKF